LRLDIVRFHTVASTVVRTVVPLNTSGNEDGRSRGFNNLGQLAFRASFTDGSAGIFVADLTPTTPTLLLDQLADTVIDMHLGRGVEAPLLAILQSALKKLGDGNETSDQVAISMLEAFKATVAGKEKGKQISGPGADRRAARADEIIACPAGCVSLVAMAAQSRSGRRSSLGPLLPQRR